MSSETSKNLNYRSEFLLDVFKEWVDPEWSVLEIGHGTGRNVDFLNKNGYSVVGIDKKEGTAIEDVPETHYDVIYSMSALFQIPPENNWVFEKIARMADKLIITVEGETTHLKEGDQLFGRDYSEVFKPFGFQQVAQQNDVFNQYGVLRIMKSL